MSERPDIVVPDEEVEVKVVFESDIIQTREECVICGKQAEVPAPEPICNACQKTLSWM